MPDYIPNESPWGVAANTVGAMGDPIMQMFARLPIMRAELAMSAQRLAMQRQEEDRLNRQLDAQIPHIQAQTASELERRNTLMAQAGNFQSQQMLRDANMQAADRAGRLSSIQNLGDEDFATEALNSPTLRPDLQASGISSAGDNTPLAALQTMIQSALGSQRERVALGSPASAASMMTPISTPGGAVNRYGEVTTAPPPFTLQAGAGRYTGEGKLIAQQPENTRATRRSAYEQMIVDAAKARGSGVADPSDIAGMLQMTNMLPPSATSPQQIQAPQGQPTSAATTQPGQIYKGYRFKGGDRANQHNWEKVQ